MTGASTGQPRRRPGEAEAISWRAPYQSGDLRKQINRGEVEFVDMHLSHVPQAVLFGFFGRIDLAVIEATEVTADGRVYLTTSIGTSPTYPAHGREGDHRDQPPPLAAAARDDRHRHPAAAAAPPPSRSLDPLTRIGGPYARSIRRR